MNEMVAVLNRERDPADTAKFIDCCAIYRRRLDAIHLIKQINHLVKAVQKHRGLSMAVLAGDKLFEGELLALQQQVDRRIAVLDAFAAQSSPLLDAREREQIYHAWATLKTDWRDDNVIDNFELHCHFVEQLLNLMTQLGKHLERPISDYLSTLDQVPRQAAASQLNSHAACKQLALLVFACKQMPDMVELVAKIRGLATHAIVQGTCDYVNDRKLRYLLQCTKAENEKLRVQMGRMPASIKNHLASLPMIKTYDLKLMFLLNSVEQDILSGGHISIDQRQLFELATQIINVYVDVITEGLELLQTWQEHQLEAWLTSG
ncbi:lytic murein transglycosylase [Exilibacterium tricleocarpae]|uniref:Lytic murein transglycosylase n=1 Tax=Exilibacterium tricleocarpae TaxID=2591008 RepID=A0A545STE3_9GAMM|nr:lytic murein transglycosylase [Exilibacterium tricleocarpae]TQV68236.1 lytic murein transglycosylase [Exilibacterium tricleocarpae]